ncbi:MAG: Precorrin-6B methylase 2 [Lachnospiraceae bacterium]|nr:Precorrin-6B methylase 2 [Lachnospiraceae bacterium]
MQEKGNSFRNTEMMSWMGFFSNMLDVSPEKIHLMNICTKKKNVIPLIEAHKRVMIFADERNKDLCEELWEAGLGDCKVWYGFGNAPGREVKETDIKSIVGMELTGPTVFFIVNEHTRESYRIGIKNENFSRGPIRYVGREIRAVIMSMLDVDRQDTICIVDGESIVIEAAIAAREGTIIAVEPDKGAESSMRENAVKFGVHNVEIVGELKEGTLDHLPTPRLAFIVASKRLEEEIALLLQKNDHMQFIIYTLELDVLASIKNIFDKFGIRNMDVIQISVSKTNKENMFVSQPAPWLISGEK